MTNLLLVPDTNALYANPALEQWDTGQRATLVLLPQVVHELDRHKTHHPSEEVRRKASSMINRFEEFARRGDTFDGVPLAGVLGFREVSLEPDPGEAPAWLRLEVDDDRLLAAALELQWRNPTSGVVLITRDRNLRNKARQARLATDVPPESPAPVSTTTTRPRQKLPDVVLGHAGATIGLTPPSDLAPGEYRRLIRVEPRYPIENKGTTAIRNVTSGVRTRDGRDSAFASYRAQLIGGGETSWVENVGSIPLDFLEETHESAAIDNFLFWARFTDSEGSVWEVVYDPQTRTTEWLPRPSS